MIFASMSFGEIIIINRFPNTTKKAEVTKADKINLMMQDSNTQINGNGNSLILVLFVLLHIFRGYATIAAEHKRHLADYRSLFNAPALIGDTFCTAVVIALSLRLCVYVCAK
jgi:hypothetical protein